VSARATLATAARVLWQIRRDRRTVALLLVVPTALLTLMRYVFEGRLHVFQTIGPPLCGLFPFIVMFLVTSVAMLRERTTGTLERLMTLPLAKLDILAGYALAFGMVAAVQTTVLVLVGFVALGLDAPHGAWVVAVLAVGNAMLGMALGLFVSAFARTEFQAVQFMPALVFPQLLLCGLFVRREDMAAVLDWISWTFPLVCVRRAAAGDVQRRARRAPRARRGGDRRRNARGARPRRAHAQAPDTLERCATRARASPRSSTVFRTMLPRAWITRTSTRRRSCRTASRACRWGRSGCLTSPTWRAR
jgi:ABC-2 type transport system permease protein